MFNGSHQINFFIKIIDNLIVSVHKMNKNSSCSNCTTKPYDVLCGRGKKVQNHKGNIFFRKLIASNKKYYHEATRSIKLQIAKDIVLMIRKQDPPGRFLEFNQSTGEWNDIGDRKAFEKTRQALRESQHLSKPSNSSVLTLTEIAASSGSLQLMPESSSYMDTLHEYIPISQSETDLVDDKPTRRSGNSILNKLLTSNQYSDRGSCDRFPFLDCWKSDMIKPSKTQQIGSEEFVSNQSQTVNQEQLNEFPLLEADDCSVEINEHSAYTDLQGLSPMLDSKIKSLGHHISTSSEINSRLFITELFDLTPSRATENMLGHGHEDCSSAKAIDSDLHTKDPSKGVAAQVYTNGALTSKYKYYPESHTFLDHQALSCANPSSAAKSFDHLFVEELYDASNLPDYSGQPSTNSCYVTLNEVLKEYSQPSEELISKTPEKSNYETINHSRTNNMLTNTEPGTFTGGSCFEEDNIFSKGGLLRPEISRALGGADSLLESKLPSQKRNLDFTPNWSRKMKMTPLGDEFDSLWSDELDLI